MKRAFLLIGVGVAAAACCAQAFALTTASASIGASIVAPSAGIQIVSSLVLPTVTASTLSPNAQFAGGAPPAGSATSGASPGAIPAGNAALTIHGQAGDTVSTSVPESFQVIRTGGTEALTVTTNTNAAFGVSGDTGMLAGTVMNGNTMSVNVGGSISLASAGPLVPGPYEGLLVVLVQYN
jgi:hypothetical protein